MNISDAINNAKNKINNAYDALEAKGAIMPSSKTLEYMKGTIEGIPEFKQTLSRLEEWTYSGEGGSLQLDSYISVEKNITVPNIDGIHIRNGSLFPSNVVSVDLQNVPFVNNSMDSTFLNRQNLISVNNINQNVTSMSHTFYNCTSLNQNIQIPNSVTNMFWTFKFCNNLNKDIQIPNSVTIMVSTFNYCRNMQGTINILSNQVGSAQGCFDNTSLPKNVYIPFKYSNGVNSATFDSFVSAGYLYTNGVSNNQHGVTVYDLNAQQEEIEQND